MELIKEEFHECGKRILCNIVLERLIVGSFFKRFNTNRRRILALGMLFILFEIIELLALVLIQESIPPIFISTLFAAFVASLSFYVVSWCYQYTVDLTLDSIRKSKIGKNIEKGIVNWLRKAVNHWDQLLASIVSTILIILILYVIEQKIGLPFNCNASASFVSIGLATFGIAQGGYWAIKFPLMTRELKQGGISEIVSNPLYPKKTPFLIAISKMFTVYAIGDAVMVTMCLIGLFPLGFSFNKGNFLYPLTLIIAGYIVTPWTFFYPQFNIAKVVKYSKENTLLQIESESNSLYEKIDKLQNADLERLKFLMEIRKNVSNGSNAMISVTGLWWFIGSFITPTIVAVLSTLIKGA